jgi:hypothetical protein
MHIAQQPIYLNTMNPGVTKKSPRYGHILAMFGLFLSFLTFTLQGVNAPTTIAFGTASVADLSNEYRTEAKLSPLVISKQLTESAQAKADDMATKAYFAHNTPEGATPWTFFDSVGYSYTTAGENLALTNQSASSVADGWFNSPGHRANLLSSAFAEVGYGIAFAPTFSYKNVTYSNVYLVAAHYALPQATTPVLGSSTQPTAHTMTSGTLAVTQPKQPKLSADLAYIGLGIGIILVIVGLVIEIRRFLRHLPLVPNVRT